MQISVMKTKNKNLRQIILLVISFLISLVILFYFWVFHKDFTERINVYIMILALCYVMIELLKKNIYKQVSKWNRIYYLGLFAVVAPIALENKISLENIRWINNIGVFFLVIPLMLEASILIKSKKQEQ